MKQFDFNYCGIELWVEVSHDGEAYNIEKCGYYTDGICKQFDWESAFDYDHFINIISEIAEHN